MNAELAVLRETIDEAGRGLAELEKSGSTVASDATLRTNCERALETIYDPTQA